MKTLLLILVYLLGVFYLPYIIPVLLISALIKELTDYDLTTLKIINLPIKPMVYLIEKLEKYDKYPY